MGLFGAIHGWGEPKRPTSLKSVTYILQCISHIQTWHSYTLPKEDPKKIWITWHTLWILLISAFFHGKSANFAILENTNIDYILVYNFSFFYFSLSLLKNFWIDMVTIFMVSAKLATLGLLKIKIFRNKGYDVIIPDYDVIKKSYHVTQIIL